MVPHPAKGANLNGPEEQASWAQRRIRDELTAALHRAVTQPPSAEPPPGPGAAAEPLQAFGRPITFNATMVRAILAGNKTQTRRPIKPIPEGIARRGRHSWPVDADGRPIECKLAQVGEPLWVREPWREATGTRRGRGIEYEADLGPAAAVLQRPWRAGRFLPRTGSRITLMVKTLYPQRLGELTPQDAVAEGMPPALLADDPAAAIERFRALWDKVYAETEFSWSENPWVWVVRFKALTGEERLHW